MSSSIDNNQAKLKSILKSASESGKLGGSVKKPPLKKQVTVDEDQEPPTIKLIAHDNNLMGMSRN
jgi:hypothetical protein